MAYKSKSEQTTEDEAKAKKAQADAMAALKACRCGKEADFEPVPYCVESISEQRLRDKLGHDLALNITSSWTDEEAKTVSLRYAVSDVEQVKTMSFAEVCKHFGWKSFEISPDKQTVFPKW